MDSENFRTEIVSQTVADLQRTISTLNAEIKKIEIILEPLNRKYQETLKKACTWQKWSDEAQEQGFRDLRRETQEHFQEVRQQAIYLKSDIKRYEKQIKALLEKLEKENLKLSSIQEKYTEMHTIRGNSVVAQQIESYKSQ